MRFYGGSLAEWHRTPQRDLVALWRRIPSVHAEESLQAVSVVALGTGSLKPEAAQRLERQWTRAANEGRRPPQRTREQQLQELRRFAQRSGIPVTEVVKEPSNG